MWSKPHQQLERSSRTRGRLWQTTLTWWLLNTHTRDLGTCLYMFIEVAAPLPACSLSTADAVSPPVLFQLPALPVLSHLISTQHRLRGLHRAPSAFSELFLFSFKEQSHTLSFLKFVFTAYLFKEHFWGTGKCESFWTQERLSPHALFYSLMLAWAHSNIFWHTTCYSFQGSWSLYLFS